MNQPIIFEYLELACYGMTPAQIAKRYGRVEIHIRNRLLMVARRVGRLGLWKFHIQTMDDLYLRRRELLERATQHGFIGSRKEAA